MVNPPRLHGGPHPGRHHRPTLPQNRLGEGCGGLWFLLKADCGTGKGRRIALPVARKRRGG
ncbi:hypothetical protein FHS01_005171 [Longimicrobium terrae]|uniref:Uncharacterized protein n=1 Tax=Longimicrobium terrae TaxID=1639882 RepID=A0A841H5T2_9BACT|nr:hypothetical protein [Longimicrobium terrae]MBB6073292.1 hypothetical protein [Longimicrobium terrae]